jgi:diketogulonate reductase-like aldo/keto reductase
MESFVDSGQVHRLGIANCYNAAEFQQLYEAARIKPSVLQNRFYSDSNFDTQIREICKAHNIWYQSFWTLSANRGALALPAVKALAEAKNLTPQTLMYAFIMSLPGGYGTPLSGTTSQQHMKEDVAIMERMQSGEVIFETESELRDFAQILGMPAL